MINQTITVGNRTNITFYPSTNYTSDLKTLTTLLKTATTSAKSQSLVIGTNIAQLFIEDVFLNITLTATNDNGFTQTAWTLAVIQGNTDHVEFENI
jgi:hypothetical protein